MANVIAAIAVLSILGALFGLVLAVASKVFEVKKDPREEEILSHLAGANCGGCGFPGCRHPGRRRSRDRLRSRRPRERCRYRQDHGPGGPLRRAQGRFRPLQRRHQRRQAL